MFSIRDVAKKDNLILAYNRLLTNPESTYKNFFRDTYSTYGMAVEENITLLRDKVKSGYLPINTIRVFMPKANGLSRMYTLMSIEDQIVYQAYANVLAEALSTILKVKKRYRKSVFGNLYSNNQSLFFYQKWQDSYKAYTKAVIKAYEEGSKYIASFDLTACYDSINHHLLRTVLKDKCRFSDTCANSFIQLLEQWESSNGLELATGIPQGPQASGIVAEAVLAEYDSYIEELQKETSFRYFRYVDDIRILADNEETVRWVLFLLDKRSKELGLFPQSSKITVHEISNIDDEIKRISKPLFEDEFDHEKRAEIAVNAIKRLIKENPADLTTIKRYFQYVKQDAKSNKLAIATVQRFPNMIHSFAFYIQRYPRKIPPTLSDFIYGCCQDKTQQFSSGILLEAAIGNLNCKDADRFTELAKKLLNVDKKHAFIVDSRYRSQLLAFILLYDSKFGIRQKNYVMKSNWWVRSKFAYQAQKHELADKLGATFLEDYIKAPECELATAGANCYLLAPVPNQLPPVNAISPYAQNIFKRAKIIQRNRYSNSQITRYLYELTGVQMKFQWKKRFGKEHDQIERTLFTALGYWKTDLTAFVNLWDTIDDRICSLLKNDHAELGGYILGKIGGIEKSKGFINYIPKFHKMCMELHQLRLHSHLSHSEIKNTHQYTGPVPQGKRKPILKFIVEGIQELILFW
ncbi:RNA-directed DNA polymerase [Faecalispora anaeroviscerum]|uniref:RNA-directed DNA polymerase n=1 Tax=Faecalispora anaeroviscerum TaxID=2991836 RepID=UPI0024B8D8EA|nr:RNA-directed DNA polymerase [Faecalispora anaeroviscerum]